MYRHARENPSFSSSLLDEIYRSIDERADHKSHEPHKSTCYRETTSEKQSSFSTNAYFPHGRDLQRRNYSSNGREYLIENWMGKEVRSVGDFKQSSLRSGNSSSSSSDSSSGGGFSSSETESVYYVSSRPKPIRTSSNRQDEYNTVPKQTNMYEQRYIFDEHDLQTKQKHEGKFVKTKSRAMKIYGDLKKAKQPISPGGRLATFLNSIFTTSNTKSTKISSLSARCYEDNTQSKSASGSTCSSASSFSRSCLSNTPSSRGKSSNNKKRSVRFYPVSVIVGDDSQPCGHKSVYGDESNLHALKFVKKTNEDEVRVCSNEKTRRIEEAARNLLRNYQKKVECELLITSNVKVEKEIDMNYDDDDDNEDDDDVASNASSDLFELENLSAIGMESYGDELPVYETTHLDTSLALGNGFRM